MRRAGGAIATFAIVVALAGCSSSHAERAAAVPTTTATTTTTSTTIRATVPSAVPPATTTTVVTPSGTPPTAWKLGSRRACLVIASPGSFPFPTFVQSGDSGAGRIVVVRVSDLHVVQVLAPACPPTSGINRQFLRSPNGHLFVQLFDRSQPTAAVQWTDLNTGTNFLGNGAKVSPDATRVATDLTTAQGMSIVRQYDAATGQVLCDLAIGKGFAGVDWSADGRDLVVAVPGFSSSPGGVYVVPRDAHVLPAAPVVANTPPFAYADPAVLANGHAVVFESEFPVQHNAWAAAVVDIDLQAGTARTVLGNRSNGAALPKNCDELAMGAVLPAGPGQCRFTDPGSADGGPGGALLNQGGIWLYDGTTVRRVGGAIGNLGAVAHW